MVDHNSKYLKYVDKEIAVPILRTDDTNIFYSTSKIPFQDTVSGVVYVNDSPVQNFFIEKENFHCDTLQESKYKVLDGCVLEDGNVVRGNVRLSWNKMPQMGETHVRLNYEYTEYPDFENFYHSC